MTVSLAEHGLVPVAEMPEELAHAARGIPLHGRDKTVKAFAVVDAEDFERVAAHRWQLKHDGYAARKVPKAGGGQVELALHRFLMGLGYGDPEHVDHRNHNLLDNRRANLRRCTKAQNAQNQRPEGYRGSTSAFRGVCWYKPKGCWHAQAKVNGKVHNLGYFTEESDAAEAAAAFRRQRMPFSTN